jgi:hypothetical protein
MNTTLSALLTSSVIAGIIGAFLNGFWNRRVAKKAPKTQLRAEAYGDFVLHIVSGSYPQSSATALHGFTGTELNKVIARLLLFGEGNVVRAASTFLGRHTAIDNEYATTDFAELVCEMRKSLITGHSNTVSQSIRTLLSTIRSRHNKP